MAAPTSFPKRPLSDTEKCKPLPKKRKVDKLKSPETDIKEPDSDTKSANDAQTKTIDTNTKNTKQTNVKTDWSFASVTWAANEPFKTKETDTKKTKSTNNESALSSKECKSFPSNSSGLGFQQLLENKDKKTNNDNDKDKDTQNTKSDSDANKDKESEIKKDAKEAEADENQAHDTNKDTAEKPSSVWGSVWSDSNTDGTFKLNFDWGHWNSSNANIDLNPSTKIGWESEAPKYDNDVVKPDEATEKVVEQMSGELDSGDKDDDTQFTANCKVFELVDGAYKERGVGTVNVNVYKCKDDESKQKGRILCRRRQILTTIINAPILKDMKFEKVGNFVRFGIVEHVENEANDNEEEKDESKTDDNDKEKESDKGEGKETKEDTSRTKVVTYLIKCNESETDTLLNKIHEIQELSQ